MARNLWEKKEINCKVEKFSPTNFQLDLTKIVGGETYL
jgi:hypothetical protein